MVKQISSFYQKDLTHFLLNLIQGEK